MNDKQQLLIDCISLLPVIGILVLIITSLLLWLLPMYFAENSYVYWLAGY